MAPEYADYIKDSASGRVEVMFITDDPQTIADGCRGLRPFRVFLAQVRAGRAAVSFDEGFEGLALLLRRRARLGLAHVAARIVAHARGMEPQPWPFPTVERHGARNTRVLIGPPTSPARHTRDLARIDQSLRRCAAGTER